MNTAWKIYIALVLQFSLKYIALDKKHYFKVHALVIICLRQTISKGVILDYSDITTYNMLIYLFLGHTLLTCANNYSLNILPRNKTPTSTI